MAAKDKYKFVGLRPDELTGGRPLAPGDVVTKVDDKDPHNRRLIEAGKLVKMVKAPAKVISHSEPAESGQDQNKEGEG